MDGIPTRKRRNLELEYCPLLGGRGGKGKKIKVGEPLSIFSGWKWMVKDSHFKRGGPKDGRLRLGRNKVRQVPFNLQCPGLPGIGLGVSLPLGWPSSPCLLYPGYWGLSRTVHASPSIPCLASSSQNRLKMWEAENEFREQTGRYGLLFL